jgi:hypothetical protein
MLHRTRGQLHPGSEKRVVPELELLVGSPIEPAAHGVVRWPKSHWDRPERRHRSPWTLYLSQARTRVESVASIEDVVRINRQCAEIISLLGKDALKASTVERALQDIIDGMGADPATYQTALLRFTSPEEQISNLYEWNDLLGSVLASDQIEAAAAEVPAFDCEEPLIPLTLCWTLDTLSASIDAKLAIVRYAYGRDNVFITRDFQTDAKHTTNVTGAPKFIPNRVWWQLIDLGSNLRIAPHKVPAAVAAGCEIFDVICQHPVYVGQQDGGDTPYLDLPGLSVKVRGRRGTETPDVRGGPGGGVTVHVNWSETIYTDHAEPVRESMPEGEPRHTAR